MKSRSYEIGLLQRLQNTQYAVDYLNAARRDSEEGFLLALKDVADANKGMSKLAEAAGVNRENLYRMLSELGNPRLTSLNDPATERAKWATMDLDARIEELVKWIKDGTPEQSRARIHALTRPFTMTDDELAHRFRCATFSHGTGPLYGTHWEFIKDLRDRYEERGKYAPK